MIQASDGGRVYVGKSALEIKLRETPIASAYGNDGPTPTPVVVLSTERIVRDAPIELPVASNAGQAEPFAPAEAEQAARRGILNKSTIVGLCLTAFACGIITTITFDHQRLRALERQVQAQSEALAAASKAAAAVPPPVAEPAPRPAEAAPVAAAPDPVVEQLPPAPPATATVQAAAIDSRADKPIDAPAAATPKPAGPRLTAARTPRPPAPRAAVRRRSVAPAESAAPASADSAADWVDPFAQ